MSVVNLNEKLVGSGSTDSLQIDGALRSAVGFCGLATVTTAGAVTYSAAQCKGGLIARDPNGAGRTDVTDTAANLITEGPLVYDGDFIDTWLINTADAAETITLSAGANVTISNVGQTIAQNESALLRFRRTSSTAVTLYIIGA